MTELDRPSFLQLYVWGTARGQFWNTATRTVEVANAFIVLTALSVYEYGLYQLILSAAAIAASFTAGLFDDIVTNELARSLAENRLGYAKRLFRELWIFKMFLALLAFLALFFGADIVASRFSADIAGYVRLASFLVLIGIVQVLVGFLFRIKVSFAASGALTIQELTRLGLLAGFWFFGFLGLREVIVSNLLAAVLLLGYTGFFFVREYRGLFGGVALAPRGALMAIARQYSRLVAFRYAVARLTKGLDVWAIRIFINTEAVGLYALAINILTLIYSFLPTNMFAVLLPWELSNRQRLTYLFHRLIKYGLWGGAVSALAAAFIVPELVSFIFPKYLPAMPIFRLMLVVLPLYVIYKFEKAALVVLREQKILTMRMASESFLELGVLAILLPVIGLPGAAVAYLATYVFRVGVYSLALARRHPEFRLRSRHLFSFDIDDWRILRRVFAEAMRPGRWLGRIQAKV